MNLTQFTLRIPGRECRPLIFLMKLEKTLTQFPPVKGERHIQCSQRKQVFLALLLSPLSFTTASREQALPDSVSLGGFPWWRWEVGLC